jgi:hypothetical protein
MNSGPASFVRLRLKICFGRSQAARALDPDLVGGSVCLELVDLVGIEPTTSSMPWKRAPSCATGPLKEEPTVWREDPQQTKQFSPTG